jgi:flagellar L-ring protein precursor FlgH
MKKITPLLYMPKKISKYASVIFCITTAMMLSGCNITPSTITKKDPPLSNANMPQPGPKSGAIFSTSTYRSIFEGRRASMVGDILTVNLVENTNVTKNGVSNMGKKGSAASEITNLDGTKVNPTFNVSNSDSVGTTADGNSGNTFSGSISAVVTEVRPNGNLVILGEKQIGMDSGVEFIRFSGVVNPYMITNDNSVSSNTIAEARVEYRTNSTFDLANIGKTINRFFLSIFPG